MLGLFGGADESIPPAAIAAFDDALDAAGVEHGLISLRGRAAQLLRPQGRPSSRRHARQAWAEVLGFVRDHV